MSFGFTPLCYTCEHFIKNDSKFKCKAYPEGIPKEIIIGDIDHTKPYFKDGGYQYQYKNSNTSN